MKARGKEDILNELVPDGIVKKADVDKDNYSDLLEELADLLGVDFAEYYDHLQRMGDRLQSGEMSVDELRADIRQASDADQVLDRLKTKYGFY